MDSAYCGNGLVEEGEDVVRFAVPDLLPHLGFKGPICELARQRGLLSAGWAQKNMIRAPSAEHQMINGRIVSLRWGPISPSTAGTWV